LSPWAILTLPNLKFDYHYTTKSETYWQEFTDIKSCLNFDCPLESQSYAFWLWNQLKSSPLLELYTRLFLTLFDNFDIVLQHDISAIKALEVSLKLKQNLFRKHDYAAFMKQLNGASLVIISPAQLTCNLFVYHIGAFKLIEKYLVISKDLIIQCFHSMLKNKKSEHSIGNVSVKSFKIVGGGISKLFTVEELQPFINGIDAHKFKFISYSIPSEAAALQSLNNTLIFGNIPLITLTSKLGITELKVIAKCHQITVHSKIKIQNLQSILCNHICDNCQEYVAIFEIICDSDVYAKKKTAQLSVVKKYQANSSKYKTSNLASVKQSQAKNPDYKTLHLNAVKKNQANNPDYKTSHLNAVKKSQEKQSTLFPPISPSESLQHTIISNFCKDTSPEQFMESGCTVCGRLTSLSELTKLSESNLNMNILIQPGMSQKERTSSDDPIVDIEGPILDNDLNNICK
jgi:hypothetical protein